jgi:mannosyltransferase OCH1-like enzyme
MHTEYNEKPTECRASLKVLTDHVTKSLLNGVIWIRMGSPPEKGDIELFSKHLNLVTDPVVLITSDGDRSIPSELEPEAVERICAHPMITSWYTQNYDDSGVYSKMRPYPIGLDLHTKRLDGLDTPLQILEAMDRQQVNCDEKALKIFSDISVNSNDRFGSQRRNLSQLLRTCDPDTVCTINTRVSRQEIWRMYAEHEFVVSPPGNGLDCHRTWEVLAMGSVPIVRSSTLDGLFRDLPVIIVSDWTELRCANLEEWRERVRDKRGSARANMTRLVYPFSNGGRLHLHYDFASELEDNIVPRVVWKTGPFMGRSIKVRSDVIIQQNSEYDVVFLNDVNARTFLKESFGARVLDAFDTLKCGAYKADLIRYCLLYKFGGIYSDLRQKFLQPLNNFYKSDDALVLVDDWGTGVQISFMIARRNQPVFRKAIEMIVDNVEQREYGRHFLDVTGPWLFKRALDATTEQIYRMPFYQSGSSEISRSSDRKVVIACKFYEDNMFKSGSYAKMWEKRDIFDTKKPGISP